MLKISPTLPENLKIKIEAYEATFNQAPCVVIIHHLASGAVVYMSQRGLDLLQTTMQEITSITDEQYYSQYFNAEHAADYAPKILGMLERNNDDEMITHFQQVRFPGERDWTWHLSSAKIFHRDADNYPTHSITVAMPIDAMHHMTAKAERLLQENNFLRENFKNFSQLTPREKEVLRLSALGKSAAEIACELCIAQTTVETHRRNFKSKLQITTHFELSQYARAFDLI